MVAKILPVFPRCNAIVCDRACKMVKTKGKSDPTNRVKFWCVDKFHAHAHSKKCPCSPLYVGGIKRRLAGVNTSAAEQLFRWFRGYARVLNNTTTARHIFLVH
eukprot:1132121-Amphidinium_carterae.1